MKRVYPYLRDPYIYNSQGEKEKMNFLATLDSFVNQRQYVRLTLLDWAEEPIEEIQGEISSGSINKDGNSAVRTTCSLSCSVNYGDYSIEDLDARFSINKKIFVEIGVKNDSNEYPEYPILWFPQGVFYIAGCSCNSSVSSAVNLSLTLKDKMAGLNGDIAGKFPITTQLDIMDTQLPNGAYSKQKVLVYNLIQELVNHYGNEQIGNIVIEDVPERIRRVVKWMGDNNLYMIRSSNAIEDTYGTVLDSNTPSYYFTVDKPEGLDYITFETGDDVGYVDDDFVYNKELTVSAGSSITSALDQIKNWLGNYEYYYDEFGVFHFREIKNYLNTTQGKLVLDELSENQYMVGNDNSKSVFTFESNRNIISINATPNYTNIKNDFVVTGVRKSTKDSTGAMVMYHLAIEDKPPLLKEEKNNEVITYYGRYGSNEEMLIFYEQEETGYIVAGFPVIGKRPDVGNNNLTYYDTDDEQFYRWDDENLVYKKIGFILDDRTDDEEETTTEEEEDDENNILPPVVYYSGPFYRDAQGKPKAKAGVYYAIDWRTHLYLRGCQNAVRGLDTGYYYQELVAYWPQVYDLQNSRFYGEALPDGSNSKDSFGNEVNIHNEWRTLTEGNYYLDFINASSAAIGKYSVEVIGRRPQVVYKEDINCVFQPEIPDVNFLNIEELVYNTTQNTAARTIETIEEQREKATKDGHPYTQVTNEIYQHLATGGQHNAAFDEIKDQLTQHTYFATSISLTAIPAYHLQPNSRVTIQEDSTNTYGDYIVKTISFNLGPGANMTVSLNEATEKI